VRPKKLVQPRNVVRRGDCRSMSEIGSKQSDPLRSGVSPQARSPVKPDMYSKNPSAMTLARLAKEMESRVHRQLHCCMRYASMLPSGGFDPVCRWDEAVRRVCMWAYVDDTVVQSDRYSRHARSNRFVRYISRNTVRNAVKETTKSEYPRLPDYWCNVSTKWVTGCYSEGGLNRIRLNAS
jgi:hypothetical protein